MGPSSRRAVRCQERFGIAYGHDIDADRGLHRWERARVERIIHEVEPALDRGRPIEVGPEVDAHFFAECGAVLRIWEINEVLSVGAVASAVAQLLAWPLRLVQVRGLFHDAWCLRHNVTFADALYVALAAHLLTDDRRLANAPGLTVPTLTLP